MRFKKIMPLIMAFVMCLSFFTACEEDSGSSSSMVMTEKLTSSSSSVSDGETVSVNANSSDSSKINFEFKNSNSWDEDGSKIFEFQGVVSNNSGASLSSWTITIPFDGDVTVKQVWGAKFEVKDNSIILTPDGNSELPDKGSFNFGMQLTNADKLNTNGAVFKGTAKKSSDSASNNSSGEPVANSGAKDVPEPTSDDWLSVKGNKIVDSSGKEVWFTGVNWFGYNTGTNIFDGLWAADLNSSLASIADHGFNLLRLPISAELINNWSSGSYPDANFNQTTNSYLVGMNSLEIFDYVVGQCRANGMKIMIDIHCASTDSMGHMKAMWYDETFPKKTI